MYLVVLVLVRDRLFLRSLSALNRYINGTLRGTFCQYLTYHLFIQSLRTPSVLTSEAICNTVKWYVRADMGSK